MVRGLVKLVPEAESAVRQGMLEEMLCDLLAKAVEIKPDLAESFSALPWISYPTLGDGMRHTGQQLVTHISLTSCP